MSVSDVLVAARELGAIVVESPAGWLIAIARAPDSRGDLLPVREAAALAGVSLRVISDARRAGELVILGRQRSRVVRRAELERWIESRNAPIATFSNQTSIDRRAERIAKQRSAKR